MISTQETRNKIFEWFSNSIFLFAMTQDYMKFNNVDQDEKINLLEFSVHLRNIASKAFELILSNIIKRVEPTLKTALNEALTTQNIIQNDRGSPLDHVFSVLMEYITLSNEHCVFYSIRKTFFQRIFKFFVTSTMDALLQSGTSYGGGIQLKMLLTQMQEWARNKIGSDIGALAEEELEAVRQAANVLCLLQKCDLAQDEFRQTVCPLLRPKYIWLLLQSYRPDQFDSATIPASFLSQIIQKEEFYKVTERTFEFNDNKKQPLRFDFEFVPPLDLVNINIPKVILDRPGFSFLKSNVTTSKYTRNGNLKW